jgi:polysaccharide biosynthesis protein PslH
MQILFLAHRLPYPPDKGEKIRSFWELRTLARRHDVDLFCFYDDPQDQLRLEDLRRYCRSYYAEHISAFVSRARLLAGLFRRLPLSNAFFHSRTMTERIAEAVQSRSYDLIFVFSSSMGQYAERWPNLPVILDLVDVDSDKWTQYANSTRGLRSWLWKLESHRLARHEAHLLSRFSKSLVCTEAEAQLLRSRAPEGEIGVLQNWLDTEYYRPESVSVSAEISALQPYVVFTGSMDYFPNVGAVRFFCREVFPVLRSQVPDLKFVIVGRNPIAEVKRLGANSDVCITGTVPDVRPYLRAASAAVAPMHIARGVQNKILEALAMGLPVVASSMAAAALPRELASLLRVADEPEDIVYQLLRCLEEPNDGRAERRQSVVSYVATLDLAGQLEDFVQSAVAQLKRGTCSHTHAELATAI